MVYHSVYGERVRYKVNKPTILRHKFSRKARSQYLYPTVITTLLGKEELNAEDIELTLEGHLTLSNLSYYLREKIKLTQNEGLLIFCETKDGALILPSLSQNIDYLYKQNRDDLDRILYLIIKKQEMYG